MKRKVNKVGTNTLTVSLPSKWAKKHHIQAGDEIEVAENGKNLVLGGQQNKRQRHHLTIHSKDFVKRLLFIPYILGYDEIKVSLDDSDLLPKIEDTVDLMMGFEIMDSSSDYCILKNVAKENMSYKEVFRRIGHVLETMGKELDDVSSTHSMRKTINKLVIFSKRILHTAGEKEATQHYLILSHLESISILYRNLAVYYSKAKQEYQKDKRLIGYVQKNVSEVLGILYTDGQTAKLKSIKDKTYAYIQHTEPKGSFYSSYCLYSILEKLDRIASELW